MLSTAFITSRFARPLLSLRAQRILAALALAGLAIFYAFLLVGYAFPRLAESPSKLVFAIGALGFAARVLIFHAAVAATVLALLALAARRKLLALATLPLIILGLGPVVLAAAGMNLAPRSALAEGVPPAAPAAPQPSAALNILSANLNFENRRFDLILAEIRATGADIICLQEFTAPHQAALDVALLATHPHRLTIVRPSHRGQAIYSRWPLINPREVPLNAPSWNAPALVAQVEPSPGAPPLTIINVHLPSPVPFGQIAESFRTADALAELIRATPGPLILAGDHNQPPTTAQYATIRAAGVRETCEQCIPHNRGWAGRAITRPDPETISRILPGIRIDHIWTGGTAAITAGTGGPSIGSDHLPVSARIIWQSAAQPATPK